LVALCASVSAAQGAVRSRFTAEQVAGCWQFDSVHFHMYESGRVPGQFSYVHSATIRLLSDTIVYPWSPHDPAPRRAEIVTDFRDKRSFETYVQRSGWRLVPGDSIEMRWFNGFSGPFFRLAVGDSTLMGVVQWFFDNMDRAHPPPVVATTAKRVACPRP